MFDIGWSEMAIIMLVALVVIGPKDLPRLARSLGQWVAKGRAMAREFQRSLEDMAREAELDDVKREIEKVGRTDIKKTIEKTIDPTGELGGAFKPNGDGKTPAKTASGANGKATEPAAKPEVTEPQPEVTAKPETVEPQPEAKAQPKAKTAAKPRATTAKPASKPKAPAKPRKPKTTGTTPKSASSEKTEAETMVEPR